jgi:hypothetical protein
LPSDLSGIVPRKLEVFNLGMTYLEN